ncbi:C-C chemokine receptor type 5-like [Clarias magur]|uniref:C-C chemokine receptor type 5-like n=1 Tax=Clarias magur TaxID=1594786 RepID=A0A8J4XEI3_CLAMG|nr:C-C chemokine receptor type 5-like [Clarias magur]
MTRWRVVRSSRLWMSLRLAAIQVRICLTHWRDSVIVNDFSSYYDLPPGGMPPCSNSNVRSFSQVFLPTLYSIVIIVGLVGNSLVLCVLVKYHKRSNVTDVSLFNLAVSDLLFLFSLLFWVHFSAKSEWIFGSFMCHAVTTLFFMILCRLTADRYAVIVHAHTSFFYKYRSVKPGLALGLFMWALSLGASLPNIIFSSVKHESNVSQCKVEYPEETAWLPFSYIKLNILGLVIPLSVMMFCYSRPIPILMAMKSQKKHKAVRLILVLIIVFFLFWTP